jgi:hypothetical protein
MHRSRLAGFIIDCRGAELGGAARFWSRALGLDIVGREGRAYVRLDGSPHGLSIEVQSVSHPSRVHLDVESDDVEAEAARLEALGARRVKKVSSWWVMEAPTGQRFCVVQAHGDLARRRGARAWGGALNPRAARPSRSRSTRRRRRAPRASSRA